MILIIKQKQDGQSYCILIEYAFDGGTIFQDTIDSQKGRIGYQIYKNGFYFDLISPNKLQNQTNTLLKLVFGKQQSSDPLNNKVLLCNHKHSYLALYQLTLNQLLYFTMEYQPDRQFQVSIPLHQKVNDVIIYNFKVQDFLLNQTYTINFRFKDLQDYHKKLLQKKFELPEFPKTHFWISTNKDPELIKQRKNKLEYFFNATLNDPKLRGQPQIKQFIRICKQHGERLRERKLSVDVTSDKSTECTRRSKSVQSPKEQYRQSVKLVK